MKKKYLMLPLLLSGFPFATYVGAQDSLTINFTGMDSLNNLNAFVSVWDVGNNQEIDRSTFVVGEDSVLAFEGLTAVGPYYVDLFVDNNSNGRYDAPPLDKAWRIMLDSLAGDTTVTFDYNDSIYTDITWRNRLRLAFTGMDTVVGRNLYLSLRNQNGDKQIKTDTVNNLTPQFDYDFFDVKPDSSYQVVFFADLDTNTKYDTTDYAWLINLDQIKGDTVVPFTYNTDFADSIVWIDDDSTGNNPSMPYTLTVNFSQMTENVGKSFNLFLKEMKDHALTDSISMTIDSAEFMVIFDSLITTTDYYLDFYSDINENGKYDGIPTDHSWRIPLTLITGDTIINFIHNTDYIDISDSTGNGWDTTNYMVTVTFTGYNTNVGQNFTAFLRDQVGGQTVDSVSLSPLDSAEFTVEFDSVDAMGVYYLDFFVDANSNGSYDAPPTDQSWRIPIVNINSDTTINFIYDTNYTDITVVVTGVVDVNNEDAFNAYPNPVQRELTLSLRKGATEVSVYTVTGAMVLQKKLMSSERVVKLNVSDLKPGMYILRVNDGSKFSQQKFLKQ